MRLNRGQMLSVVQGRGSLICAHQGAIWITEENRPHDIVLRPGACHQLLHSGVSVVEACSEVSMSVESRKDIVKPVSYQALLDNPHLLDSITRRARRDRAEAIHDLIVAVSKALLTRLQRRFGKRIAI
jgi:Protein of unknown function (DUF2917)